MPETHYEDRTDSVEEKIRLLQAAQQSGNDDLALSLAASIRDTLWFQRQQRPDKQPPVLDAEAFCLVDELPEAWAQWADGWDYYKLLALDETMGVGRRQEPVDLAISFRADQVTDPRREVRVSQFNSTTGTLHEVPSQVYGETILAGERGAAGAVLGATGELRCHLVFLADAPAHGRANYLIFYGNPHAELPRYPTDLQVRGKGFGLDIENHHYAARLSRQMGQLERLRSKHSLGLELFAGGEGHGEPPNIDWAHDYLASGGFQKFRMTNWATCPNYEVVKGPLCVKVHRWGFPHSPVHPLFTPSRMHMSITYTFYAGLPYFLKEGSMEMAKDFDIVYLRDDEWLLRGYSFTNLVWIDEQGKLHDGPVRGGHADNLWGVGFYHRSTRDAFMALFLEHRAENFDGLRHSGAPSLYYRGHGQLWSRWAARDNPQFQTGARLLQKNAYLISPYPEQDGAEQVERLYETLRHPLAASAGEFPNNLKAVASGHLARRGETAESARLKRAVWDALREVGDEMMYRVDANVVDMGYIYDMRVHGSTVYILMTMPHRGRPRYRFVAEPMRQRILQIDGVHDCIIEHTWDPPWQVARLTKAGRIAMGLPV